MIFQALSLTATRGIAAPLIVATALALGTQPASARPRTIENADLRYSVILPSECRTEEGPGTLEAICAPDFDEAKSAEIPTATSLLLEIDAEPVPSEAKTPYGEAEFRLDVPEAVCGEAESSKVKLVGVKETKDGATSIFTASVSCPEIKFLGLPERSAQVRYIMSPNFRYRMMTRALTSDAAQVKAASESFLASFKALPEKKS